MSRNLLEDFNIKKNQSSDNVLDYYIFKDKYLLDNFRTKILNNLSEKNLDKELVSSSLINSLIDEVTINYDLSSEERNYLHDLIDAEVNGYGPISELLNDDSVSTIMVNSPKEIYIETNGIFKRDFTVSFINDEHVLRTIIRLLEKDDKTIDFNNPIIEASLSNGSKINAIIPPLSKNPIFTIHKYKEEFDDIERLIGNGSLTPYMARFLAVCVASKVNILVSGASKSGKTSFLNALANLIPEGERLITIEDVEELNLKHTHVIPLVAKTSNYDGQGEVTLKALVKSALTLAPDRIIVGELKSGEAFNVLQAMSGGYEGSMASIYSKSPKDALQKLETLVQMGDYNMPSKAIKEYIKDSIDVIVQISDMKDGSKKITSISEITKIEEEFTLKKIFAYDYKGLDEYGKAYGEFILYPEKPRCLKKIQESGNKILNDMFKQE